MIPFTSVVEVRAALGVSDEELADEVILLNLYNLELGEELRAITPTLEAAFLELDDKGAARTPAEQLLWRRVRVFSTYAVAKAVGSGLPMFGVKDLTDGKAGFSRFADSPYKVTYALVLEHYNTFKRSVTEAAEALGLPVASGSNTPTLFASAGPAVDRVTNA